jgi:hypothetical protein
MYVKIKRLYVCVKVKEIIEIKNLINIKIQKNVENKIIVKILEILYKRILTEMRSLLINYIFKNIYMI